MNLGAAIGLQDDGGTVALSRERFLLVKSGNAGLRASRSFNGLTSAERAADEPKTPFTC